MTAHLFKGSVEPSEHCGKVVADEATLSLSIGGNDTESFTDVEGGHDLVR